MRRRVLGQAVLVCLSAGLALAAAPAARAEDWPTHQHDNRRSCATDEALAWPLQEAWKRVSPSRPQPAWEAPARWDAYHGIRGLPSMRNFDPAFFVTAVGNKVTYGSSADDTVYCLDAATGKEAWTFTADGAIRLPPTWQNGRVHFGADDGHVYCLQAETGKLAWKYRAGGDRTVASNGKVISLWPVRTGVLIQNGKAYFGASLVAWEKSYLCAVDAATGKDKGPGCYKQALDEVTLQGALLATQDVLFVMQGTITPLAFSLADGKLIGSTQKSKRYGGVYAILTPDGRFAYGFGPQSPQIFIHDARNLGMLGKPLGRVTRLVVTPRIQVMHERGNLVATEPGAPQAGWRVPTPAPLAMVVTGNAVVCGYDGKVVAYDAKTGKEVWTVPVSGLAHGIAVANGRIFVSTDDGTIHCFAGR